VDSDAGSWCGGGSGRAVRNGGKVEEDWKGQGANLRGGWMWGGREQAARWLSCGAIGEAED